MRNPLPLLTALLIAAAMPGSVAFAAAEDDKATLAADTETIKACLAAEHKANHDGRACIGRLSDPCEEKSGGSTMSMLACENKEIDVWDGLLNQEYKKLLAALEDKPAEQVRAAQRLWVKLRDADCQVPDAIYDGGTMSIPIAAQCVLKRTAWRTLQMRDWWDMAHPEDAAEAPAPVQ